MSNILCRPRDNVSTDCSPDTSNSSLESDNSAESESSAGRDNSAESDNSIEGFSRAGFNLPLIHDGITELLQRPTHDEAKHVVTRTLLQPGSRAIQVRPNNQNTYKLHEVQDAFESYCLRLRDLYSPEFWRMLGAVYRERIGVIDRVLKNSREVFLHGRTKRKKFPASVRDIRAATLRECGNFPSYVLHEVSINVAQFRLPGDIQSVKFKFVNPLWAWVGAANEMIRAGHVMHFEPKRMVHELSGERLYGAGVQYGDVLNLAAARTPPPGKPALFGISFDGGDSGVSNRSVYPVCVSALNFNGTDPLQCGLVGFIPALTVPDSFKEGSDRYSKMFQDAKAHVIQKCVGAVLDEVENVARDGFSARIGKEIIRLHPFLVAVRVDSKERKTYFGLRSDRTCAICRFRKGWSSLRKGTPHAKNHITRLWRLAVDTPTIRGRNNEQRAQKRAREQLVRHGFTDRKRRCFRLVPSRVASRLGLGHI